MIYSVNGLYMNASFYNFFCKILGRRTGLDQQRQLLLSHCRGKTLEIGAGTGLNLAFYPNGLDLTLLEPDQSLSHAIPKRESLKIINGDAQHLPFPDKSFDTVVGTLVLCTIENVDQALAEIFRVLQPAGTLLLLEHIRPQQSVFAVLASLITPLWKQVAGGCHLDRNPEVYFKKNGYIIDKEHSFWRGCGRVWILNRPA